LRLLHKQYQKSGAAELLIVYQKEPHPGQLAFKDVAQPESFEERVELAKRMKLEYELPMTILVDSMEDQSRELLSDLPSPAFIINGKGVIVQKFPWADADLIGPAVAKLPKQEEQVEKKDSSETEQIKANGTGLTTEPLQGGEKKQQEPEPATP